MKKTLGTFLVVMIGITLCITNLGNAISGETQTKSVVVPYNGDALQEISLEEEWTFTTTIVDSDQPLDLRVFESMGEVEKWRNGELAEFEELGTNVARGSFDFIAEEERLYYFMIEVSVDGEDDANVQYKWGLDIPEVDSDGDGVSDPEDAFPNDPNEDTDSDGDGVGDNSDAFPNDASKWVEEDSSEDSPFVGIPFLILLGILGLIITRKRTEQTEQ